MRLQLTLATATGVVALALADAVGHGVAVAVVVGVTVADAVVVGATVAVAVGVTLCRLKRGPWNDVSLVADSACVVPAAAAVGDGEADADVAGAAAAAVDGAAAAVDGAAAAVVADAVGQAPTPAAKLRLPPLLTILMPRTRPTTIAMATGTASRAERLLGTYRRHADRCSMRIQIHLPCPL
jgi:hypothetical protein